MKTVYRYKGPVFQFDRLVANEWTGETMAVSPEKALANLSYQFKKNNGLLPTARVTLSKEKKYLTEVSYIMD